MKIYKIHHKEFEWDAYMGHVIVASNDEQVIELAKKLKDGAEPVGVWDSAIIECVGVYAGEVTQPFILLSDYRAG